MVPLFRMLVVIFCLRLLSCFYFYLVPAINNAIDHWLPQRNEITMGGAQLMYVVAAEVVCPSPQSSLRLDLGSFHLPLMHCRILPSSRVNCVVPKNHAGLSTHAAPCSPLTFLEKSPTDLIEIIVKGEVVAPHHQKEWVDGRAYQAGIKSHPLPSQSTRRIFTTIMVRIPIPPRIPHAHLSKSLRVILRVLLPFVLRPLPNLQSSPPCRCPVFPADKHSY